MSKGLEDPLQALSRCVEVARLRREGDAGCAGPVTDNEKKGEGAESGVAMNRAVPTPLRTASRPRTSSQTARWAWVVIRRCYACF